MSPEPLYHFRLDGKIMPARTLEDFVCDLWFTPEENRRMEACREGATEWVPLTSLFPRGGESAVRI